MTNIYHSSQLKLAEWPWDLTRIPVGLNTDGIMFQNIKANPLNLYPFKLKRQSNE